MNHRPFGTTGWTVSAIGLGGMPMSIDSRPDESKSIETIHAALDAGMTFIDTADVYCIDDGDIGHNERLIAKAVASWSGGDVKIATKGGLKRPGGAWTTDGSPEHLRAACEASLRALGTDCIDVYQLHAPDKNVPFADSVGALKDLKDAGKVAHVGLSNVSVDQIKAASAIVPIVSVQNRCNPMDRHAWVGGVVQHCTANNIAFLPYSPVGGYRNSHKVGGDEVLGRAAQMAGITPYELALAWLLSKSPVMLPIPGASKPRNARSSASAGDIVLSDDVVALMDQSFPTA